MIHTDGVQAMQRITVTLLGLLLISSGAQALDRGPAHTLTRANYCKVKLQNCIHLSGTYCTTLGGGGAKLTKAQDKAVVKCATDQVNGCNGKFGVGSNCMSKQ